MKIDLSPASLVNRLDFNFSRKAEHRNQYTNLEFVQVQTMKSALMFSNKDTAWIQQEKGKNPDKVEILVKYSVF